MTKLLNTYPVGEGYTSWTDAGLHAQLTFNAANNAGTQYPSGDASALASAVPSNAYAFSSPLGNFGGDLQAGASLLGGGSTGLHHAGARRAADRPRAATAGCT